MTNSANDITNPTTELRAQRHARPRDPSGRLRLRVLTSGDLDRVAGGPPLSTSDTAMSIEPVFRNEDPFYSEGFAPPPRRLWRGAVGVAALSIAFMSLGYLWGADRAAAPEAPPSSAENIGEAQPRQDSRWAETQAAAILCAAVRDAFRACASKGRPTAEPTPRQIVREQRAAR